MEYNYRRDLIDAQRIVFKVGTSTLTHENGKMNFTRMDRLAMVLSELINEDKEIILVSSGCIAVGMGRFGLKKRPAGMGMKQAMAAIGQCELMNIYSRLFATYNQTVAQMLLTKPDINDSIRKTHVMNTFSSLLELGVIPIVNENDSVSVDEIKSLMMFGDNDTLSAQVTKLVGADLLIILSDIDGLYDSNPKEHSDCNLISVVEAVNTSIRSYAGSAGSKRGTGGMLTKLDAAEITTEAGANMIIANGLDPAIVFDILKGDNIGTLFLRKESTRKSV